MARLGSRVRAPLIASLVALCLALGGCSVANPFSNALMGDDDVTGSITPAIPVNMASVVDEADRAEANAALDQALDPQSPGVPARWSNAATGRRGTFTAKGDAFVRNDQLCRTFIATVEAGRLQSRYQGAACRIGAGSWTIGDVKFAQREA